MSGDVQPRKRKDKRRKKEGGSVGAIYEPEIIHKHKKSDSDHKSFDLPDQGEKIHVQSEHGVGGNICVKIIFFCLFGLLVGAVGLIYLQSQGSSDVDLPTVEESRFAEYFTGWLDDSNDDHEHEALEQDVGNEHDEHEENDEHDEHYEQDEQDDDDNDHEKEDQSAEQDSIFKLFGLQLEEEKEEPEESEMTSDTRESEESAPVKDDKDEEDEDLEDKEEDEDEEDEEEDNEYEEEEQEEDKNEEDSGFEKEDDDDDDDDASQVDENEEYEDKLDESEEEAGNDKEEDEIFNENKYDNDKEEGDDDDDDGDKEEVEDETIDERENDDKSKENDNYEDNDKEEEEIEDEKTNSDDLGYDEIYESDEDEENMSEPEDKEEAEEMSHEGLEKSEMEEVDEEEEKAFVEVESSAKDEEEDSEDKSESGGVAVKLGVGIALVIVAHLVLVQKWKSMSNASTDETAPTEVKPAAEEKQNIENLTSEIEPVISRRQTLVPENVSLNGDWEEEENEELEEEELNEEQYSEEGEEIEEENFKKTVKGNLETFEKLSWDDGKEVNENEKFEEDIYNEEEEEDEEEEEEEEEEEREEEEESEGEGEEVEGEEEEEDFEEDIEEEVEDEYEDKRKKPYVEEVEITREDVKPEEAMPTPPPRAHKSGRGSQDFDEDFVERLEEVNEVEISHDGVKRDESDSLDKAEEPRPIENKPGNEDDWAFRQEFDFADEQFEHNPKAAVQVYDKILTKKPTLVKALIGRARALDHLAEKEKSNAYLKQAINAYKSLLLERDHLLDDETFVRLSERCIERIRFSGAFNSAIDIHKALIMKFPQAPKYRNALAVTYLMLNRIPQARAVLNETLTLWPGDGFALVHYGFILKTSDNNMEEGAKKLMAGIETKQEGVIDGMFFFHLGDALNRLGRGQEAMKWYELGVKEGLFLSKYQRSLYNVNRLKGQPWWTKEETTYQDFFRKLEQNWREIRREGLELLHSKGVNLFKQEAENLKDTGDWKQLDLYFRGRKQTACNKAPVTCGLVSSFKPASTCTRGQIKFSVMLPDTHVWPHCGPTNCRLRSHLGLVVPKKTYIRVADETRSWEEGKFIIFDDSFEHEVWHNGTGLRLVLIVDVWHPELTNHERLTLSPI